MKAVVILGAAALLAGCNSNNEQNRVESGIRNLLSEQGNVTELSLTRQGDGNYAGPAAVRTADGATARLNCTATRQGDQYMTNCRQIIDDALLEQLKTSLRQTYAARGVTVVDFQLTRLDEDRIGGHIDLRAPDGEEARLPCTGGRPTSGNGPISVNCQPPTGSAEAARPAPEQAPAEEGAPAETQ